MTSYVTPKKNSAYIMYAGLPSQANPAIFKDTPTLAAGDFKVSIDGAALANLATLPTNTPGNQMVKFSLSAAEMNGDNITVVCHDAAGAEWSDVIINIQTSARQVDDLAYPATSGRSMVVDASGLVDANTVKVGPTGAGTAQTAGDIFGVSSIRSNTAQAGAASTITLDAAANATDSFYRNTWIYITGGTGAGQARAITAYVGSTKVATVAPNWITSPDNTSTFAVLPVGGVDIETWRAVVPNALVSSRVDSNVGAMGSSVLTATAIAADAITAAKVAADVSQEIRTEMDSNSTQLAKLGAPAGASISADIAAIKVDTAAVKVQTDKITFTVANQVDSNVIDWKGATAPAMTGDAFARLGAPAGASVSADVAAVKTVSDAIKLKTDNLPSDPADESLIIAATDAIMTRIGMPAGPTVSYDIATVLSKANDLGTWQDGIVQTAGKFWVLDETGNPLPHASDITNAIFAYTIDSYTFGGLAAGWSAILLGKVSGGATGTDVFRAVDDSKDRVTASDDASGNRTAIVLDLA